MLCPCRRPQCMVRPRASLLSPRVRPLNATPKAYLKNTQWKRLMLASKSSTCPLLSHFLHKLLLTVYCSVWRCSQWAALLLWESSHCRCWPWQRWSTGGWAGCDPHPEIEASILLCPSRPGRAGLMPMTHWQCKGTKMWKSIFNVTCTLHYFTVD